MCFFIYFIYFVMLFIFSHIFYTQKARQKLGGAPKALPMLLLGGAIGNLADRIRLGYVVDFVDVHYNNWHWPAFNVADSAIVIGVTLMLAESLLPPRTPPATPPPKKPRKALPPLPPPKPAAVDASLGTYAVDATLVEVPRRDVTIDGASLEFCARAGDADAVAELGRSMGTRLWPASNVLVQYLDTLALEGERVLELGAGAGLCGLYAQRARKCAKVVLTDHDVTTLKLLRHNAALNASCGHVHALDWHSHGDLEAVLGLHGTFSTILASDVLFQARDLGAFYTCAAKLLASHGRLIVAYEDRVAGLEAKVLAEAKRAGFAARSVPLASFFDPDRDVVDGGRDEARLFGEAVLPGNGSWDSLRLWEMSLLRRPRR